MKELQLKIEELEERIAPCAQSGANAFDVGTQGHAPIQPGMGRAMSTFGGVDNPNGDAGMFAAVEQSC
jgi:hypothetical protein